MNAERSFICDGDDYINGRPDLIMEIISPGYVRRDRVEKKELYQQYAVREYWIIDPYTKSVEIYEMQDNQYVEHQFLEKEGIATSSVIPGFTLDIRQLFGG